MSMKRILVAIAIASVIGGCSKPETYTRTEVEVPVKITEVARKQIEDVTVATGSVIATMDVTVKSEIEGAYTLGVNPATGKQYAVGDSVKKGEVIVTLQSIEQENKIKFVIVKMTLETAQDNLKMQKTLFEKGAITQTDLKRAEQSLLEAQYSYDNALMQLEKFKIVPPFDGMIVNLPYYTPGLDVAANVEMFRIMDYATLSMDVNLPGKLLGIVVEGQKVRVSSYLIPDKVFDAAIIQVTPVLESSTRTFKASIAVNNKQLILKPGMFVKAEIVTDVRENAIVIPKNIILVRRNEKTVFIVSEGVAQQRKITTGLENQDELEVVEGLQEKEYLVVEGFETLRSGAKVAITRK